MKQNVDTQVLFSIVSEAAVKLHFFKALSAIEQNPSLDVFKSLYEEKSTVSVHRIVLFLNKITWFEFEELCI